MTTPTLQEALSQQSAGTPWFKTFPESLDEEIDSKEFVFRLMVLSSSMVLERRQLLPESTFGIRKISRLQIPSYNINDATGKRLKKKMDALKPAIEKQYLKDFSIVFYRKPDEEDVFEVFSFKFRYGENTVSMDLQTGSNEDNLSLTLMSYTYESTETVKDNFIVVMKYLNRYVKHLGPLPDNADASFRLAYTDETPADYAPEGFETSDVFYTIDSEAAEIGILGGAHAALQISATSLLPKKSKLDLNQTYVSGDESFIAQKKRKSQENVKSTAKKARFAASAAFVRPQKKQKL